MLYTRPFAAWQYSRTATSLSVLAAVALAGCTPQPNPRNIEPATQGGSYEAQYRAPPVTRSHSDPNDAALPSIQMNAQRCRAPLGGPMTARSALIPAALKREALSPGDLVDLRVANDTTFTNSYVVSRDGTLKVPFLPSIRAQGRSPEAVESDIAAALVKGGFFSTSPRVSVLVSDFAPARVAVSGAVFEPHTLQIGQVAGADIDSRRQAALGASTDARDLAVALRNAGGIRPDADLSAVELIRGTQRYRLDLRPMMEGRAVEDVMLLTGDEIRVPSRGCFQDDLMRPSPISPPGISLFMSNLTQPAANNASSAIGREVREVPYGTRFLQAAIDANCVGGARATSADRSAALVSRNPISGHSVVIGRNLETLMARPDRDDFNPYLLPGDALACYDSGVTNLSDIGRILGIFVR